MGVLGEEARRRAHPSFTLFELPLKLMIGCARTGEFIRAASRGFGGGGTGVPGAGLTLHRRGSIPRASTSPSKEGSAGAVLVYPVPDLTPNRRGSIPRASTYPSILQPIAGSQTRKAADGPCYRAARSWTTRPPTIVYSASASRSRAGSFRPASIRSTSNTAMSASLPGVSVPLTSSSNEAHAGFRV